MQLHDPQRPHLGNGFPAMLELPRIAHGSLYVFPLADGKIEVGIFLPSNYGGSSWRKTEVTVGDLPFVVQHYADDPEGFLRETFGWVFDPRMSAKHKKSLAIGSTPAGGLDLSAIDGDGDKADGPLDLSILD